MLSEIVKNFTEEFKMLLDESKKKGVPMDKKLADILWTARWAVKNNYPDDAYAELTKALVYIGAEKEVEEEDRPTKTPPPAIELKVREPKIVKVKGVKTPIKRTYNTASGKFEGLVVHYTVSGRTASSAIAVLKWLVSERLCCMVMDEDGVIYIPEDFDILTMWGSHAGKSKWKGRTYVSQYFAGMEICCWGKDSKVGPFSEVTTKQGYVVAGKYQQYTEKQEAELENFILWAKLHNPHLDLNNVVGHDELRREYGLLGDKADAGGSLSVTMPAFREKLIAKWKSL